MMQQANKILIISTPGDLHVEKLVDLLEVGQYELLLPGDISDVKFSIDSSDPKLFIGGDFIPFIGLSIWYRKPEFTLNEEIIGDQLDDEEILLKKYQNSASLEFYKGICSIPNEHLFLLNTPNSFPESNKLFQLMIARQIGLNIPKTLVTNNITEIKKFLEIGDVIIKSLTGPVKFARKSVFFHTNELTLEKLNSIDEDLDYPVFLQQKIEKEVEYRIILIGSKIYACEMDTSKIQEPNVDTRLIDIETLPHRIVELPLDVEEKLFILAKKLNVNYAAIDMIRDNTNKYIFLEANTNGQYYWIEKMTGAPLTQSIRDLLLDPAKFKLV